MIPYSLDNNKRNTVMTLIVLISVFITVILDNFLVNWAVYIDIINAINNAMPYGPYISTIIDLIGKTALPGFLIWVLLYRAYAKQIWKSELLYRFHHVPNLNGEWHGEIYKTKDDGTYYLHKHVTVSIKQDWDRIKVTTHIEDSPVRSFCECTVAAIDTYNEAQRLKYAYENKSNAVKSKYVGYNELEIEKNKLFGSYITTKPSMGTFNIKK